MGMGQSSCLLKEVKECVEKAGNSAGNRNFDDYGKPGRDPVTERKRKNPGRV